MKFLLIKKRFSLVFVMAILLSSIIIAQRPHEEKGADPQDNPNEYIEQNTGLQSSGASGVSERADGGAFIESVDSLTTSDGKTFNNVRGAEIDSNGNLIHADSLDYGNGKFTNVNNFKTTPTGYTIDSADFLSQNGNIITGGKGIVYAGGKLKAEHADTFIGPDSITTNANNLESEDTGAEFSVEKADSVLSGGITFSNVANANFKIYGNAVEAGVGKGNTINITDSSFNNVQFESNGGKVIVGKEEPVIKIENGTLTTKKGNGTEKVEANNSAALVEMDPVFGIVCIQIKPPGVYWYNENLLKDFGIHVPEDSSVYKLCLRKNEMQYFDNYDGIVDFPDKKIILNKIVNYLRYPFSNNGLFIDI
jgi:hypothetical protein